MPSADQVVEQVQSTKKSDLERRPVIHRGSSLNTAMKKAAAGFSKKCAEKKRKVSVDVAHWV